MSGEGQQVKASSRAVFFDRDGVVNVSPGPGYVLRWEDFHFQEGIVEVLRVVRQREYRCILVSNQRSVAKGLISLSGVEEIHSRMQEELKAQGVEFDAIYFCPHEEGKCDCRKPQPGMLLRAAREYDLDLTQSWIVGDADRDIEAGKRAGAHTIRLCGEKPIEVTADFTVNNLTKLRQILAEHLAC